MLYLIVVFLISEIFAPRNIHEFTFHSFSRIKLSSEYFFLFFPNWRKLYSREICDIVNLKKQRLNN